MLLRIKGLNNQKILLVLCFTKIHLNDSQSEVDNEEGSNQNDSDEVDGDPW